jgi:hypothetical protein
VAGGGALVVPAAEFARADLRAGGAVPVAAAPLARVAAAGALALAAALALQLLKAGHLREEEESGGHLGIAKSLHGVRDDVKQGEGKIQAVALALAVALAMQLLDTK